MPNYSKPADGDTPIRRARIRKKWSQDQVARSVGINASTYNRIELGRYVPNAALAEKLSKVFEGRITEMQILYPERFV